MKPQAAADKRFHVTTFGCQMNEHDSERMKGMLGSLGYAEAEGREDADLILFNTCSIRENADNRFISHLGEAKRLKSERPDTIVGVGALRHLVVAERLEHPLHPLGVVLVHLAPERGDVERLHRTHSSPRPTSRSRWPSTP